MLDNILQCLHSVAANAADKLAISIIIIATSLHVHLFVVFCCLVILDTLTKFIAISYKHNNCDNVFSAIAGIRQAHIDRAIDSHAMRIGFCTKMGTYLVLVTVALLTDNELMLVHSDALCVKLVVTYLSLTELLSILENLNDANIKCVAKLLDLVKRRSGLDR